MFFYRYFITLFISCIFCLSLPAIPLVLNFDFSKNHQQWTGNFADYPINDEAFYQLAWGWSNLPTPLVLTDKQLTKGMFLSGDNRSDDLFMYIKRRICGLKPHTTYSLYFKVIIENNVPPGMFGIGGSPGESVFFKVGASTINPLPINQNGFYLLNVDKGNQSQGGENAIVIGDLANPLVNLLNPQYEPKEMESPAFLKVRSDAKGRIWLFVGTDSGFEGSTDYYIAHIQVSIEEISRSFLLKPDSRQAMDYLSHFQKKLIQQVKHKN